MLAVTASVAMPFTSVATLIVDVPFENVPLAPVAGAVKVTDAPVTGLLLASLTMACSEFVNVEPIVMLCELPAIAIMLAGGAELLVRLKLAVGVTPAALAVTRYGPPGMPLAVNGAEASPVLAEATVIVAVPFENVPLAPLAGAVNVTCTPLTGLLLPSVTLACRAVVNTVLTVALCEAPAVAVMFAAGPGLLVSEKFAAASVPVLAVTVKGPPAVTLAVKAAVATPPVTVNTVIVAVPFENVPLAPVDGAVKITEAPTIGLLELSVTVACREVVNAEPIIVLCELPAVAVMLAAGPGLFVRLKLTGVNPETVAVTE